MSKKIKTFDIILPLIPVLLLVISVAVIYSLVFGTGEAGLAFKQGVSAIIGLALMAIISFFDYRIFRSTSWIFYLITMALLVYVDFFGHAAGGAMRWIDLGFFQLQPSELAKVFLILILASFYSSKIGKLTWKDIFVATIIFLPTLGLVLKEPDLGTGLVLVFIFIVLLYASKPNKVQTFVITMAIVTFAVVLVLSSLKVAPFTGLLQDYQRNRILTFIDPNLDPHGRGYNVRQAQIAAGSGGIFGKGLGHGTQSQLQYLPKPQTDFIFSGIAESFGFLGTMVYLSLFIFLIIRIINIGNIAKDNYGMLISYAAAGMLIFQIVVNVGMNLGLMPVTGIPLPFASYGGSAILAYLFLIGLVQSVYIRHKKISF